MLLLLVLAGVVESVGAVSVLPLLGGLIGSGGDSPLQDKVDALFHFFGVSPTFEFALVLISCAMVGKAFLTLLAYRQIGCLEADVATHLRLSMLNGLLRAKWEYYTSQPTGKLIHAMSTEASQAGASLRIFAQAASFLIQAVVYLGVAALVSWQVLVAGLVGGALFTPLFCKLVHYVRQAGNRQAAALNDMTATFTDSMIGAKPLKIMGIEGSFVEYVRVQARHIRHSARQLALGMGMLNSAQEPCMTVLIAGGMYVASVKLHIEADLLLSMAFFFQRILSRVSGVQQSMQNYAAYEGSLVSLVEKNASIQEHQETRVEGSPVEFRERIELRGVGVSYGAKQVLKDFNLALLPGSITAIYGPSGVGKTTVADIVGGLIRPSEGEVYIDGQPLSKIDVMNWRQQIGYVPQEVFLFNDTVRANIMLGRECSDDDVWAALEQAGADGFVRELSGGLDYQVGEHGRSLSGGQRQRLMIARALLSRPDLLILDEATSGLDEETERLVLESVERMKGKYAVLAISHQKGILEMADQIIRLG